MKHEIDPPGATEVHRRAHPAGGGDQIVARWPNGYGASIVQFSGSYGGDAGCWELAVLRFGPSGDILDYALTYSTPITDDVLGWLSPEDVHEICERIAALEAS